MFFKLIAAGRSPLGTVDRARTSGRQRALAPTVGGTSTEPPRHRHTPEAREGSSPVVTSALRRRPPLAIQRLLSGMGIAADDVLLSTPTDINSAGQYCEPWLVVTDERAIVFSEGESPRVTCDIRLTEASEFRCEGVIGAGLLQARVNGVFIDLIRYSNALGDRFAKVCRKLERKRHGEPLVVDAEDNVDARRCKTCNLMLDFAGETCPRCVNKGAVLARMWTLMLPYKKPAAAMLALLVFGVGLDLISPRLTQQLIDHVLPPGAGTYAQRLHGLLSIVLILAGVQVARMGVNIINGRLSSRVGTAITFDMRSRLVKHLQQLSVSYYDRQQVGSLVARVAYDTEALSGFVSQLTGGFVFQLIMVVLAAAMMFSLDVRLSLYTLIPAPLVIAGSVVFWRFIYPRYYRLWDASGKQAGMLSGILSGVRVVKSFGQETRETERFDAASNYLTDSRRKLDTSMSTFNPIMGLVFQLGGWIVWYVGGRDVLGGHMSLGGLMAFFGYLGMFYSPLGALTQFTNWLTSFVTQAHRIFEILDAPVQIAEAEQPVIRKVDGQITFDKVTFGYNRHHQVLKDIDVAIAPGEMIGVVGRSGSGKSTLVNLICRFYDANEGAVRIDGIDVRDYAKENLRSQIGVVLQEPFLFRGSILENITYGKPEATPEQVITAAKAGNCHDFILRHPHAYDTWVGERGAGLSGGERQRVSIARVLLTDPRILILDEATSSVDAESEAAIQAAMAELVKGRTTIAIAHRLSTLRNANRILVVDNGRIVEQGPHEQLLAQDGLYARLVKIQGQFAAPPPTIDHLEAEARWNSQSEISNLKPNDGALPPINGFHPRWLSPDRVRIHLCEQGALHVTIEGERPYGGVFAVRCLPVKYPTQYLSLRYLDEHKREVEVGLIRDIADWPADVQALIEGSLCKRFFVHSITAVRSIENVQGYLNFDVDTDLGPRTFIMRWQADKAQDYGPAGRMLVDTEENRYLVRDIEALPERDRALFMRFIYW
jgi:ATP-binding cassette subfamily B protein